MENIGCFCDDDLEPISLYRHTERRAKKEHTCDECDSPIKKGEQYHVHEGMCDGRWLYVKNCQACETIRHDYGCGAIGGMNEYVKECIGIGINEDPGE